MKRSRKELESSPSLTIPVIFGKSYTEDKDITGDKFANKRFSVLVGWIKSMGLGGL